MSRCFPYIRPYNVSQFNSSPSIESLKRVEKTKNERKEKKRDKKDKEKSRVCKEIDIKKHNHKPRNKHKRHQNNETGQDHQNMTEHFENSSLTEKYVHRVNSQNSSNSENFGEYQEGVTEKATEQMSDNLKRDHSSSSPYELKLKSLFENWVPPSSCSEIFKYDDDEQEWLFSQKRSKRIKRDTDWSSYYQVSGSWPRVCHLPELDLYALPFTVPF